MHITFPVMIDGDRAAASGSARVIVNEIDLVRSTGRAIIYTDNQHDFTSAVNDAASITRAVDRIKQLIK